MYENQFGFQKLHSTNHAVLKLVTEIENLKNRKMKVCAIFCDISKAFDTVPHDILLDKLHFLGFEEAAVSLISDYLENRKQSVYFQRLFLKF